MKRFRLYVSLLALMSLALLSPCGAAVQLTDGHSGKKTESKGKNSFGSGMTSGFSAEPDSQSYFRRATVSYTVNPFIALRIQTASIVSDATSFLSCTDRSIYYEYDDCNSVSPRAPPSRI